MCFDVLYRGMTLQKRKKEKQKHTTIERVRSERNGACGCMLNGRKIEREI